MGAVRFLKPWSLYNSGETAGFDAQTTAMLINSGIAVDLAAAEKAEKAAAKAAAKAEAEAQKAPAEAAAKAAAEAEPQKAASQGSQT